MASVFFTSALDGGEWSASRPCLFIPGETGPGINWRLSGPQSRFGRYGEELAPAGNRTPIFQPVSIPTELSRLCVLKVY
jgi:hypothetical protein